MNGERNVRHTLAVWVLAAGVLAGGGAAADNVWDRLDILPSDPLFTRPPHLDGLQDDLAPRCEEPARVLSSPLTLSDAVGLALCHSPQLQGARATTDMQAAQLGEARAAYLPTINVGMSELNQKTRYPDAQAIADSDRSSRSRYATLTWRLLDFGGRSANRRSAEALLEAALASRNASLQKTLANVIGTYFDVQTAKASRDAKEKTEALMRQTLEAARRREARGAGAQSDTLQAQTALAKAELESGRALGTHERSLAALMLALGLPPQQTGRPPIVLASDSADADGVAPHDLASWLSLAQERHPALAAARAQLASVEEKLTVTRSEGLPSLDFTQSQYVNGRPNQGLSSSNTKESVTGLTVNFPLFEGFGRTYKLRSAQAQIELRETELRDIENQVLSDVVKAHADAMASLRNTASSLRLLDAAQEALESVQRKYDRGVVDILEMLNVQVAFADAEQERVRALAEWRSARLRLLATTGTIKRQDFRTD